jgi:hypothetical protein
MRRHTQEDEKERERETWAATATLGRRRILKEGHRVLKKEGAPLGPRAATYTSLAGSGGHLTGSHAWRLEEEEAGPHRILG